MMTMKINVMEVPDFPGYYVREDGFVFKRSLIFEDKIMPVPVTYKVVPGKDVEAYVEMDFGIKVSVSFMIDAAKQYQQEKENEKSQTNVTTPLHRPFACFETGQVFDSVNRASVYFGCTPYEIDKGLRDYTYKVKGMYSLRYLEDIANNPIDY